MTLRVERLGDGSGRSGDAGRLNRFRCDRCRRRGGASSSSVSAAVEQLGPGIGRFVRVDRWNGHEESAFLEVSGVPCRECSVSSPTLGGVSAKAVPTECGLVRRLIPGIIGGEGASRSKLGAGHGGLHCVGYRFRTLRRGSAYALRIECSGHDRGGSGPGTGATGYRAGHGGAPASSGQAGRRSVGRPSRASRSGGDSWHCSVTDVARTASSFERSGESSADHGEQEPGCWRTDCEPYQPWTHRCGRWK